MALLCGELIALFLKAFTKLLVISFLDLVLVVLFSVDYLVSLLVTGAALIRGLVLLAVLRLLLLLLLVVLVFLILLILILL